MVDRRIVCIEPATGRGDLVLVEVHQEGTQPLDVRLVGCEGENPYVTTIKQRNLVTLKHKFKGTDEEWVIILSHFLLQQPVTAAIKADILDGVRLVYTLKDSLELSFRQDVHGIKVTLGEIVLPRDDDFEFNPFVWAQISAKAHSQTLQELVDLKTRVSSEQETIAKLNAQLDDFIKIKNETETAMLQQFMELLNEKKRKIRDQNRLLAGSQVDKSIATAVQSTRRENKPHKAGASRQSKRKAAVQIQEPDLKHESDSDHMEIDEAKQEDQTDDELPAATPDPSDDETDEEETATSPPQLTTRKKLSETLSSGLVAQASRVESESEGHPPPKRELPFGRPATRSKQPQKQPSPTVDEEDEAEDEDEDEEL
ncbi:hypothetical protein GQ44DRAFT_829688 [Phaeosphaeriaceae sp. PMI808]|nr:hypothetical protein GQ44DRAFT_829688 [Phaeosphaeriaceae sp. PMI808]